MFFFNHVSIDFTFKESKTYANTVGFLAIYKQGPMNNWRYKFKFDQFYTKS